MKYGFDIDGTLDIQEVAHLARALIRNNYKVYFITASGYSKKALKAKLNAMNLDGFHKLLKVGGTTDHAVGVEKGNLCNKHHISLYFDNNPTVLKGFSAVSKIARVQVLDDNVLQSTQKPRADECLCMDETRTFRPSRCYHCTSHMETAEDRQQHWNWHHGADAL